MICETCGGTFEVTAEDVAARRLTVEGVVSDEDLAGDVTECRRCMVGPWCEECGVEAGTRLVVVPDARFGTVARVRCGVHQVEST